MTYQGVSFNIELIRTMSLEELLNHKGYQHLWPEDKRVAYLTELYNLVTLGNSR